MFRPFVTAVAPRPIPVPSESMIVVAAAPLVIAPVALIERSSAVIDSVLPPVLNVAPAARLNVPVLSLASVSASIVVRPAVVRLSLIVIPSAAFSVSVPAPVISPPVASSVIDPADVNVRPVVNCMSSLVSAALSSSPSINKLPVSVVTSADTSTRSSACTSSALNVEALLLKLTEPVASSVVVFVMLLLLAAVILSTVTLPPV